MDETRFDSKDSRLDIGKQVQDWCAGVDDLGGRGSGLGFTSSVLCYISSLPN